MRRSGFVAVVLAFHLGMALTASAETAPVAVDDYAETDGKTVHIDVLGNDSGDFDPSTLALVTHPSLGGAVVIATGSPRIKYTAGVSGTDSFRYSVCSPAGACSTASVIVNVAIVPTTTTPATTIPTTTTSAAPPQPVTTTTPPSTEVPTTAALAPSGASVTTATTTPSTIPSTVPPATTSPSDPIADLAAASGQSLAAAGTRVGERHQVDFVEDVRFLARKSADTLKLVAVPAVMVSGIVGFLLIGLPQNTLGGLLGFLLAKRRRSKEKQADA